MSALTFGATRTDEAVSTEDNWPHTRRPLPWLVAAFLAMLFLVPFGGIKIKLHLPADATPDRLLIVAMVMAIVFGAHPRVRARARRLSGVECAVLLYAAVALLSVVVNAGRLYRLDYFTFVEKGMLQLLSYVVFFFIVVKAVRASEIRVFSRLILWLSCATSLGTIIESRTGYNVFYTLWGQLLRPIATVPPSPTIIHATNGAKPFIVGPTDHPLALASMLTVALPFAIVPLLRATRPRERAGYIAAIALIIAATLCTREKTAMFAPITAIITIAAFRPKLLRWAPLGIPILIVLVHIAAPGVLGQFKGVVPGSSGGDYSDGRTGDYAAVTPDILSNLLLGRGFGSLDPLNWRWYRILDNEYLDQLWETGVVGLVAYVAMLWTPIFAVRRLVRRHAPRADFAVAAAAGCAAFAIVSATYDAMGFGEAIYSFLFVAALIAVMSREQMPVRVTSDHPEPRRPRNPSPPRSSSTSHGTHSGRSSTRTPVRSS